MRFQKYGLIGYVLGNLIWISLAVDNLPKIDYKMDQRLPTARDHWLDDSAKTASKAIETPPSRNELAKPRQPHRRQQRTVFDARSSWFGMASRLDPLHRESSFELARSLSCVDATRRSGLPTTGTWFCALAGI